MRNVLNIMRGLPGSGKSYRAQELEYECVQAGWSSTIYSTDDLFMVDGEYRFDPKRLRHNHEANLARTIKAMDAGINMVFVDNTNTQWWECEKYVRAALERNYDVAFILPNTSWQFDAEECYRRNTHGVPLAAIEKMLKRFQDNRELIYKAKELAGELNKFVWIGEV